MVTPSLTRVFSLTGRDPCAAQQAANSSAPDVSPQDEPTLAELSPEPEGHGPSPSPNGGHAGGRTCCRVPVAQCPLWPNVRGRYLRQRLSAQALHMVACRPTIFILAEAQSKAGFGDPPFLDYTRHVVLPAHGQMGAGLDVYVRTGTTTWATLIWGKEDANALLMEVLTPWGKHHVLAAHAPQINIGVEPYVRRWAGI